jgi:hypothetical protein
MRVIAGVAVLAIVPAPAGTLCGWRSDPDLAKLIVLIAIITAALVIFKIAGGRGHDPKNGS